MTNLQYGFSGCIYTGATNIFCLFRNGLGPSDAAGKKQKEAGKPGPVLGRVCLGPSSVGDLAVPV